MSESGLTSIQRTNLTKIDPNLVTVFVERWNMETSSFHVPFGEMTITLDDVSCLLHLPIKGVFWTPEHVIKGIVVELAIQYLGVDQSEARRQVCESRGAYYILVWLYDIFVDHRVAGSWHMRPKHICGAWWVAPFLLTILLRLLRHDICFCLQT